MTYIILGKQLFMNISITCASCKQVIKGVAAEIRAKFSCPHCNAKLNNTDMSFPKDSLIGGYYKIVERIQKEASEELYLALRQPDSEEVILKILPPGLSDPEQKERFRRGADIASSLEHDNLLPVIEYGEDDNIHYLVTAYEPGITFKAYFKENAPLPEQEALSLVLPIAEVLAYTWNSHKIIHRDIKPANLLLTDTNNIKLTNMGIAKSMDDNSIELTGTGFTVGTPDYMSPEQVRGDEDLGFHTDLYSLGIVLYMALTGEKPFQSASVMELMQMQLNDIPKAANEIVPAISKGTTECLAKMLQKENTDRHKDWQELIAEIKILIENTSQTTFSSTDEEPDISALSADDDGAFGIAPESADTNSGIISDESSENGIDEIVPGDFIGNGFEVDKKVGEGSMGDIYLAVQEEFDRIVQIKILPSHMTGDTEKVERFMQEINLTADLKHPNLISVIEGGEDNGRYYLATEYEAGITYKDYLGRYGPIKDTEALKITIQIASALQYIWNEKKLLHRDLKPRNFLINEDTKTVKLTDLGIAKVLEEGNTLDLTGAGFTIGTPEYMSPEQVRGDEDLDFRSDMYALGLTLYESVVGHLPFQEKSVMLLMQKQLNEAHIPANEANPNVGDACSGVINKMLAKDKRFRYDSWDAALDELNKATKGISIDSSTSTPTSRDSTNKPAMLRERPQQEINTAPLSITEEKTSPPAAVTSFILAFITFIILLIIFLLAK